MTVSFPCRPETLGGKSIRNVIATLAPFLGPRSWDSEAEKLAEPIAIPETTQKAGSSGKAVVDKEMLVFLADRATGGQVAVLAAEVIERLTSVPHDKQLPPHTAPAIVKIGLLLSGALLITTVRPETSNDLKIRCKLYLQALEMR